MILPLIVKGLLELEKLISFYALSDSIHEFQVKIEIVDGQKPAGQEFSCLEKMPYIGP